jgi:hypothetical protein
MPPPPPLDQTLPAQRIGPIRLNQPLPPPLTVSIPLSDSDLSLDSEPASPLPSPLAITTPLTTPSEMPTPFQPVIPFQCPLLCGLGPWATVTPLLRHFEANHLPHITDFAQWQPWLLSVNRSVCQSCKILVSRRTSGLPPPCPRCRRSTGPPSQLDLTPSPPIHAPVDWADPNLSSIFLTPSAVLRTIPLGAQDAWFSTLADELALITSASTAVEVMRLSVFCRIILAPVGRTGAKHLRRTTSVVTARLSQWSSGQISSLVLSHLRSSLSQPSTSHPTPPSPEGPTSGVYPCLSENARRAALRAVQDGALGKAARILSDVQHPLPQDLQAALQALHPTAPTPTLGSSDHPIGEDFTVEDLHDTLLSFPPGSSGGFSGLMPQHLQSDKTAAYLRCLEELARLCSDFAWGRLSPLCATALAGARLIPLGKANNGVRPIAIGETIRRIAGKLLVSKYQSPVSSSFAPLQMGVGIRGGAETLIHKVRQWHSNALPFHGLLQLDFQNAFNSVSRQHLLQSVDKHCPLFSHYARACYSAPATLFATGFTLSSQEGEHQGCPCGPLFFSASVQDLIANITLPTSDAWTHWYLDDGYLAGPLAFLDTQLPILEAHARTIGLKLNRSKSTVLVTSEEELPEALLAGIPRITPSMCVRVLGSPVGDDIQCQQWIADHIIHPLKRALTNLQSLADPHAASLVLRSCLGGCKVNWILRTCPPFLAQWTASQVEPLLRAAWGTLLGTPPTDPQWTLACLPIRLGGAGLDNPINTFPYAPICSWLSALSAPPGLQPHAVPPDIQRAVTKLVALAPALGSPLLPLISATPAAIKQHPLFPRWKQQTAWSDELTSVAATTFDGAVTAHLKDLRSLHLAPHANSWLTATPDHNPKLRFSPPEWQALLRFHTGVPLFTPNHSSPGSDVSPGTPPLNPQCHSCAQPMDHSGNHALCCTRSGLYRRHNRVRDTLYCLASKAGCQPQLEATLPGTQDRPADLLLSAFGPRPVAVDVTISHPLRLSNQSAARGEVASAAEAAEARKLASHTSLCATAGWDFIPFGMDATGALGPKASDLIRRLARATSMRTGQPLKDLLPSFHTSLSIALAKGRGEMLAAF